MMALRFKETIYKKEMKCYSDFMYFFFWQSCISGPIQQGLLGMQISLQKISFFEILYKKKENFYFDWLWRIYTLQYITV